MMHIRWLMATSLTWWLFAGAAISAGKAMITIGVTVPHTSFNFKIKQYNQSVKKAIADVQKKWKNQDLPIASVSVTPLVVTRNQEPSPADTLNTLCDTFMKKNVPVIIYLSNAETYGVHTATTLYFLQLADFLGIPVVSWIADDSATEQNSNWLLLQLSPSIRHQTFAMLTILQRYNWDQFSVISTKIPGHKEFELALQDGMTSFQSQFRFTLLKHIKIDPGNEGIARGWIKSIAETDTRIILLFCTDSEAVQIFTIAKEFGLLEPEYLWIVTQSVLTDTVDRPQMIPKIFPVGTFGIGFNTSEKQLQEEANKATTVILHAIQEFLNKTNSSVSDLDPNLSCTSQSNPSWKHGRELYNYLKNVSIITGKMNISFDDIGLSKNAELNIFNLNAKRAWNQIGVWKTDKLELYDIIWPGNSPFPPTGKPKRFHLKATFLEEQPYIKTEPVDEDSNLCLKNSVRCKTGTKTITDGRNGTNGTEVIDEYQCCSGFCVDLLKKLSIDIGFDFDLVRIEDGYWGSIVNGTWNGLIASLINRETDIVITSLKINSQRERVIDFSVPFLDTGIAILVAKRTGIVSPSAFLEPFDPLSWILILVVMIQIAALSIFLFEWLSPAGYDMKMQSPQEYRFSFFRAYWLAWALTFRAAVKTDCPQGVISKLMANVWAMFTLVFIALYTANLAAFMITREEYYDLTGIADSRLLDPFRAEPALRFGTVIFGNTETIIRENFPDMYSYMKKFNVSDAAAGIQAVKKNNLDAFIYDSTVLEYLATMDDECRLLTVGTWYAKTGYGVAFPRHSKYLNAFNQKILKYKENGDLEKLQKFWFGGACKGVTEELSSSHPLGIKQFISAFLLVAGGILLAGILLALEHYYFHYIRRCLTKANFGGCCNLISVSLGRSLTFREAVGETAGAFKKHVCQNSACCNYLSKIRNDLLTANNRIEELEAIVNLYTSSYPSPQYWKKKFKSKTKDEKKKNSKKLNNSRLGSRNRKKDRPHSIQFPVEKSEVETFI